MGVNHIEQQRTMMKTTIAAVALLSLATADARAVKESFSMDDLERELSDKNGAIAVFYASWCPHCKRLLPVFNNVAQRYSENGPSFVQITLTSTQMSGRHLRLTVTQLCVSSRSLGATKNTMIMKGGPTR